MDRLKGKTAIVTGAGTGIGKAICRGYAREGADVAIVYSTSREGAEDTLRLVEEEGRRGILIQCDLAKPEDIRNVVDTGYKAFGHIDVVVNNAAARDARPIFEYDVETWDHCFNTNLRADFLMAKYVAPIMKKQGGGHIINVGSLFADRPSQSPRLAYASSKAGMVALTACLAEELGEYNIYVNALVPGSIVTAIGGLNVLITDDIAKKRCDNTPLRRRGAPEDMVGPALFMATSDCSYVDGALLHVDGGYINAD